MHRVLFSVSTALAISVLTGCDSATSSGDGQPAAKTQPEAAKPDPIESALLRQAMIDVSSELMKQAKPNAEPDGIIDALECFITQSRKDYPEFLMVPPAVEQQLEAGKAPDDTAERVAEGEAVLEKHEMQISPLVTGLQERHKAGKLTPVQMELLAQLITAYLKQLDRAAEILN